MDELMYPFDEKKILAKKLKLRKILMNDGTKRIHKKIAILGGSTTYERPHKSFCF